MRKYIILLLSLLLLCSGCGATSLDCLSETEYVAITCDSRPRFMVSGEILIEPACENLMALTLEEMKNTESTPALYTLEFYDEADELLLNLTISHDGCISFGGKTYAVTDGELDTSWIESSITFYSPPAPSD